MVENSSAKKGLHTSYTVSGLLFPGSEYTSILNILVFVFPLFKRD